jgi:2-polyprenyl-3-methyl-5-hydroxy-6-metoxy-1,4-benzoquinol methylase
MKSLKSLVKNPNAEKRVLEGSCMFDCTLEHWRAQRQFITEAINRSRTILDIGCANGLLLRSLMEWSKYDLIPYGVDPSQERLAGVDEVLHDFKNNFAPLAITELEQLSSHGLPAQFDMVYWNIWDDFDFVK